MDIYPDFPFAHFESAMVHVARNSLDRAEAVLREGTVVQDRQADRTQRYPASGLHWLLGLVRLARGDVREAETEFDRELASGHHHLYAVEFAMNAHDGAGFAALRRDEAALATSHFERALALFPEHARSLVGLAVARTRMGDGGAGEISERAAAAIAALRRGGRGSEATLAEALRLAAAGEDEAAVHALHELLDGADVPFTGWTIPVEPLLEPLRSTRGYAHVLQRLSDAAR
jgi:tetratricopeptide (TPR) repeat protein